MAQVDPCIHLVFAPAGFTVLSVLGTNYYLCQKFDTWENGRTACLAQGMDLASIPSLAVSDALQAAVVAAAGGLSYFVGGTDHSSEGSWRWVDGSPWTFSRWQVRVLAP